MAMKQMSTSAIRKLLKKDGLAFHLRDNKVNGVSEGGSGFVHNTENGKTCYVDGTSAKALVGIRAIMYRAAIDLKDFHGGPNKWACDEDELKQGVYKVLGVSA